MTGPVDNRPDPVSSPLSRGRKTDGQCSESPGPPWPEPAECRTARLLADLKYRPRLRLRTTPPASTLPSSSPDRRKQSPNDGRRRLRSLRGQWPQTPDRYFYL